MLLAIIVAPFKHIPQRQRAFTLLAQRTAAAHDEKHSLAEVLERPKLELILPMMLQIWKVVFIRGSKITTVMVIMYWIDWAAVQYCHCWVWLKPLSGGPPACKESVHRGWFNAREMNWMEPNTQRDDTKRYLRVSQLFASLSEPAVTFILGCWCSHRIFLFLDWLRNDAQWSFNTVLWLGIVCYFFMMYVFFSAVVLSF